MGGVTTERRKLSRKNVYSSKPIVKSYNGRSYTHRGQPPLKSDGVVQTDMALSRFSYREEDASQLDDKNPLNHLTGDTAQRSVSSNSSI